MPGDKAPCGGLWAPFWAFCYVITDLRIYPPPSPSHAPTRHAGKAATRIYESSYRRIGECSNTVLRLPVAQKPNSKLDRWY